LVKTETDSRDSHGGQSRIKAARFPARKTLEDFNFAFRTSLPRETVLHLGQLDFLAGREHVVRLGPPGTGKTHLALALGIRACWPTPNAKAASTTSSAACNASRHGRRAPLRAREPDRHLQQAVQRMGRDLRRRRRRRRHDRRLVHHAEILALKGDSYRLKDRDLARAPTTQPDRDRAPRSPRRLALRARLRADRPPGTGHDAEGGEFSTGAKGCTFNRP
jgi:IstB-like ATP binding protein